MKNMIEWLNDKSGVILIPILIAWMPEFWATLFVLACVATIIKVWFY